MSKIWRAAPSYGRFCNNSEIDGLEKLDRIRFGTGTSIRSDFPKDLRVICKENIPIIDYFPIGAMDLVSDRLRTSLENANVEAEFLPVKVKPPKMTSISYFALNILRVIDCIDDARSIYEKDTFGTGWAWKIKRLAIDERVVGNTPMFRVGRAWHMIIGVSEVLSAKLEEAGYVGMQFVNAEDCYF